MQSLPNIDKSAFRKGEYVGYAQGLVWRVRRTPDGWQAAPRSEDVPQALHLRWPLNGLTLADISAALEALRS